MVKLHLVQADWDYLQENVLPQIVLVGRVKVRPLLPTERDPRPFTGVLQIFLSATDAKTVADELINLFCSQGLRPDEEPNSLGLYVERLADAFRNAVRDRINRRNAT